MGFVHTKILYRDTADFIYDRLDRGEQQKQTAQAKCRAMIADEKHRAIIANEKYLASTLDGSQCWHPHERPASSAFIWKCMGLEHP